tara:strand:- start:88 stop:546 length:459 start_codon:yes stop_codon:yes gene_type:complete
MKKESAVEFNERYNHILKFGNRFHFVYFLLCVALIIMGFIYQTWFFHSLALICYPLMYVKLFSYWSRSAITARIQSAQSMIAAEVIQHESGFGVYQVGYKYSINDKKFKQYDMVNKTQFNDFSLGNHIQIWYDSKRPKQSYIAAKAEQVDEQ